MNIDDFEEKRGLFLEFLRSMRDDSIEINELQYYYLKWLFLENNASFLHAIYNSLE